MSKHLLLDLSFDICEKLFAKLKLKNFIVKQVFHWIYQKNIYDFNKMTNISLNNQKIIKENFAIILAKIIDINIDKKHETFKFLVQFHDKNSIEIFGIFNYYIYWILLFYLLFILYEFLFLQNFYQLWYIF